MAVGQEYSFQVYDQAAGLKDPAVFCMEQDPDGTLWFCTSHALYRFDGHSLEEFADKAFGDDQIFGLKIDSDGKMWIKTGWTVKYGRPGAFLSLDKAHVQAIVPMGEAEAMLLVDDHILHVQYRAGQWIQKPYLTEAELRAHPEAAKLTSLVKDRDGTLWGGCDRKICRILQGKVTVWGDLPPDDWSAFLKDRHGVIWARGQQRTAVLTGTRFELRDNPDALLLQQDVPDASLVEDRDGHILTFQGDEVASWDGSRWTNYRPGQYTGYPVSFVREDRNGSVWIGRSAIGVMRWVGYGQTEHWTRATGLASNLIYSVTRDHRNRVWIGGVAGIDVLQDGLVVKSYRGSNAQQTRSLVTTEDGTVWAGTSVGGLLRFRNDGELVVQARDVPHITSMFPDHHGNLWLSTWGGVYRVDIATGKMQKEALIPRESESVYGGNEDAEGNLWFATAKGLLRRTADGTWSLVAQSPNPLIEGSFVSTIDPQQRLWASSFAGFLRRFQLKDGQLTDEQHIVTPSSYLRTHYILSHDTRGWIWFGTDQGLDIFNGHNWLHITEEDGLIANDTDVYAFLADADGSVWVGTSRGITHFLKPEKLFVEKSLHARLRSVTFAGKPVHPDSQQTLTGQGGALEVGFRVDEDPSPYNLRFTYRLVGLSDEWQSTYERSARFVGLPPGTYHFEFVAENLGHGVRSAPVGFDITVRPPWWRRPWAYAVAGLLVVLLAVALWRWRTAQLRRSQHALERMVAIRTEELHKEKAELIAAREELREKAERDGLTRLWNRHTILDILDRELELAHRSGESLTIVLADLDYFKRINDSYGHLAGDEVLRTVTGRIQGWVRPYDFIGRFGGEELLMIFPGLKLNQTAERLEGLRRVINQDPYSVVGQSIWVTCSFGVAEAKAGMTRERVIQIADAALYRAKDDGRDCIRIGSEIA
ncbi:diguanylate cyclase [Terriglobus tenax]|uniref:diguanylate cyclase n=1 Tax=Terriglobus tenax TaxID=1111115 RepID=UPI0037D9F6C9